MSEERVRIEVDDQVALEGLFTQPNEPRGAVVVLHPHPQYGGSMHNNVVEALLHAAASQGWAALRFNFRGVGGSTGRFDDGKGEQDDVLAAASWLRERAPGPLVVMGYSFGALVGSHAAGRMGHLAGGMWVAPPLVMGDMGQWPNDAGPLTVAAGEGDGFTRVEALQDYVDKLGARGRMIALPDMDHFFWGGESVLIRAAEGLLVKAAK